MISNFYSNVNNGNAVDKCKHTLHFVQDQPYLIKSNFLNEFRTSLEKAKVRANLGIADSETLLWGNIQGDIAELKDIASYIDALLSFDYEAEKGFIAGPNFENVINVRQAAITCLDYLSKYKGEGAEIAALEISLKEIIKNLYDVDSLDLIENSSGGAINNLNVAITNLRSDLQISETKVSTIESDLNNTITAVATINENLANLNNLITISLKLENALQMAEEGTLLIEVADLDENGNLQFNEDGTLKTKLEEVSYSKGLYVKDLQPEIDALYNSIFGTVGAFTTMQNNVDSLSTDVTNTKTKVESIETTKLPEIDAKIAGINSTLSATATKLELTTALNDYVKTNSVASISGITSQNATIKFEKPAEFPKGTPVEPDRYVQSYEELLSIDPKKAWPGMEVVVIDSATMYLLKDYDKETTTSFTANSWKISDSLRIEVLESFEDYLKLEEEGKLQDDIYYYIKLLDFELVDPPIRGDYETDADYNAAYETWKEIGGILRKQIVTGAWAADLEARLKYKANRTEIEAYTSKVNNLESDLQTLQAFFTGTESGSISTIINDIYQIYKVEDEVESGVLIEKINEIKQQIASIYSPQKDGQEASGILVNSQNEIALIKADLYGDSPKFVTWEDLGSTDSELEEGETLFVTSATYKSDKEDQANAFSTVALSATSFVLGETELKKENDSLKFGNVLLAKEEDLIKHKIIKFNTYTEYIAWISDTSGDYKTKLTEDADYWNDWYFIVLDYEGVKPERSDFPDTEEGAELYNEMIDAWETNTLINYKTAVSMFLPRGSYLTSDSLVSLQNLLTDLTNKYNALIALLESTLDPEDPETTI